MRTIERILVPTDFSAPSLKALDDAIEFSRPFKAELILMFVVEREYYESSLLVSDSGAILQHQTEVARAKLEEICSSLRAYGVNCRAIVAGGIAYKAIVDAATRIKASITVISTHGRRGLAHVLIGGVAERVVQHSACPVLTIRTLGNERIEDD
jgi:nucleotide-binding universal stress UspA family protein